MKTYTLKPSAAETASTTGELLTLITDGDNFESALFLLDVTATATETGDTLDVFVDFSYDKETWINAIHFTQVAGDAGSARESAKITTQVLNDPDAVIDVSGDASAGVVRNTGVMPYVRYRSTINDAVTGGNVSFTYSLTALLQ